MGKHACFTVKGKPFFSVGIQSHNSSSYIPGKMEDTWRAAKTLRANTVATPVPWEMFEPEEGVYDAQYVKTLIDEARRNELKLALLWFGTWKNGTMEYAPQWVKKDTGRFQRALLKGGKMTHNLSPHCAANLEADKKAFCKLMEIVRDYDSQENIVIAVQIENEAGLFSSTRRDFSRYGQEAFESGVPEFLIGYCKAHPACALAKQWQKAGGKESGNWSTVFGVYGAEGVTAYAIAAYIDGIAEAGRRVYDTFLYLNVWMDGGKRGRGLGVAGIDWPSGCAHNNNLDIYLATIKNLDAIAPDIYYPEITSYLEAFEAYARPDIGYPLYVPESARTQFNSGMMFEGVGDYGAIGYHVFGGESLMDDEQKALTADGEAMMHSFSMLRSAESILPGYIGTDRLHAIHRRGEEPGFLIRELSGGWKASVSFTGTLDGYLRMDYRHKKACQEEITGNQGEPCRGLLFQESGNVFYLVGHKFRIFFLQEDAMDGSVDEITASRAAFPTNAEYLCVTEGHFDPSGQYVIDSYRTGDENRHGVFAQWDCGVIRIELLHMPN